MTAAPYARLTPRQTYIRPSVVDGYALMYTRVRQSVLFGLHQLTIAFGLLFLPLALLARQAGIRVPLHRFVKATGTAYERASQ